MRKNFYTGTIGEAGGPHDSADAVVQLDKRPGRHKLRTGSLVFLAFDEGRRADITTVKEICRDTRRLVLACEHAKHLRSGPRSIVMVRPLKTKPDSTTGGSNSSRGSFPPAPFRPPGAALPMQEPPEASD